MQRKKIYIHKIGYLDPITDFEQIKWVWEQQVKVFKLQQHRTSFWLNLFDLHGKRLMKEQAYELYGFLSEQTSDSQKKNHDKYLEEHKKTAEIEMKQQMDDYEKRKQRNFFISLIKPN